MPSSKKFPPSPEIKRVIYAAQTAGIEIGSIEIEPNRIRIYTLTEKKDQEEQLSPYDLWKAEEARLDSQYSATLIENR
jgi:hypothetical protein